MFNDHQKSSLILLVSQKKKKKGSFALEALSILTLIFPSNLRRDELAYQNMTNEGRKCEKFLLRHSLKMK